LTGRPSIPETARLITRGCGVLDRPLEPVIGRRVAPTRWRAMTNSFQAAKIPEQHVLKAVNRWKNP
jgi:hypothetical protein